MLVLAALFTLLAVGYSGTPTSFSLVSPAGTVFNTTTVFVTFTWTASSGHDNYWLYWSRDSAFSTYITSPSVSASATSITYNMTSILSGRGFWYWGAAAYSASGGGRWTSASNSLTFCLEQAPGVSALQSPVSTTLTTSSVNYTWTIPTVGYSCSVTPGAYRLYEGNSSPPTTVASSLPITTTCGTNSCGSLNLGLALGATYTRYWRVGVFNGALETLSNIATYTICLVQPTAPTPSLSSPASGAILDPTSTITFTWPLINFGPLCGSSAPSLSLRIQSTSGSTTQTYGFSYTATSYTLAANSLSPGSYNWWLITTGVGSGATSGQSSARPLTLCTPSSPVAPVINGPSPSSTLYTASPTISWTPQSWGTSCLSNTRTFSVAVGSCPTPAVEVSGLNSTTTSYVIAPRPTGTYCATVTANNGDRTTTSLSVSFSLCITSVPTTPSLISPADAEPYVDPSTTLSWSASSFGNACIFVSSYRVYLAPVGSPLTSYSTVAAGTTSFSSTLDAGTYQWRVQAVNGDVLGSFTSTFTFTVCAPSAPATPLVTYPADSQTNLVRNPLSFNITWQDLNSNSWGQVCGNTGNRRYLVMLSQTTPPTDLVASVNSPTAFQTVSLAPGYWYLVIQAQNELGLRAASNIVTFQVQTECALIAPSVPALTSPSTALFTGPSLTLYWSTAVSFGFTCLFTESDSFIVHLAQLSPPTPQFSGLTSSTSSQVLSALTPGLWYWRIAANNGVNTTFSEIRNFCVASAPDSSTPQSPTDAQTNVPSQLSLSWSSISSWGDSCATATNRQYTVYIGSTANPTTVVAVTDPSSTSVSLTFTSAGVYYWRVATSNGILSTNSQVFSFTVCLISTPTAPTLTSPADAGTNLASSQTLSWAAATFGAGCGTLPAYRVHLSQDTNPLFYSTVNSPTTSLSVQNLADGTWYWKIAAQNGPGTVGPFSATRSFTVCTATAPNPPALLTPTNGETGLLSSPIFTNLTWSAPSSWGTLCGAAGASSYQVLLDNSPTPTTVVATVPSSGTLRYSATLAVGVYYWQVVATNAAGLTSASAIFTFPIGAACTLVPPDPPALATPAQNAFVLGTTQLSWAVGSFGTACTAQTNIYQVLLEAGTPARPASYANVTAGPYDPPGSLASGVWTWTILASNGVNTTASLSQRSFCVAATPASATPSAPTSGATNLGQTVTLTWTGIGSSAWGDSCSVSSQSSRGYRILFDTVTPPVSVLANVNSTTLSYQVSALTTQQYYWRIVTSNALLADAGSAIQTFSVCIPAVPLLPTLSSPADAAINVPPTSSLTWTAANFVRSCTTTPVYNVYLGQTTPPPLFATVSGSATSFTPSQSLAAGVWYWYLQTANGPTTSSSNTPIRSFTVCITSSPTAPTLLLPTDFQRELPPAPALTNLTWTAPNMGNSCGASGTPRIDVVLQAGNPAPTAINATGASSLVRHSVALPEATYYWKIVVTNAAGLTAESQVRNFVVETLCVPTAPVAAPLLSPADASFVLPSASLSWDLGSFGISCVTPQTNTYNIYFGTSASPLPPIAVSNQAATALRTFAPTLSTGEYFWAIEASNGVNQTVSAVNSFCVAGSPSEPTPISPADASSIAVQTGIVTLTWTAVSDWGDACAPGAHTLSLLLGTTNPPTATIANPDPTDTQYQQTFTAPGTYYWRLVAANTLVSLSSPVFAVTVCLSSPPLPASQTIPADSADNVVATTSLNWAVSSLGQSCGATGSSTVYLEQANPPTAVAATVAYPSLSYTPSTPLAEGVWFWRVGFTNGLLAAPSLSGTFRFTVCIPSLPDAATIVEPASGVQVDGHTRLRWSLPSNLGKGCGLASGARVAIYLSQSADPQSGSVLTSLAQGSTSFQPAAPLVDGTWYWVVVVDNGALTTSSAVSSFTVCNPTTPTAPILTTPSNGSSSISTFPYIQLAWQAANFGQNCGLGALQYNLYLDKGTANPQFFSTIYTSAMAPVTSYTIPGELGVGTYSWFLEASNNAVPPVSSATSFFTTCRSLPPNNPALSSPNDGSFVEASSITVTWDPLSFFGSACGSCSGVEQYEILVSQLDPPTDVVAVVTRASGLTSKVVSVEFPGIYWVRVRAVSCSGLTSNSRGRAIAVCKNEPPEAILDLSTVVPAADPQPTQVSFTWSRITNFGSVCLGSSTPAISLLLSMSPDFSGLPHITGRRRVGGEGAYDVLASATSVTVSGLLENTTYYYALNISNGPAWTLTPVAMLRTIPIGCASTPCTNGACDESSVTPTCACASGWSGSACAEAQCSASCGMHGTCTRPDYCECEAGWSGDTCSSTAADTTAITAGISGAAAGLVCLGIAAGLVIKRKRDKARPQIVKKLEVVTDFTDNAFSKPIMRIVPDLSHPAWRGLMNLLQPLPDGDYMIVSAMQKATQVTETDVLAKSLVYIFESQGRSMQYLKYLISREVMTVDRPNNLFRENSLASKSWKFYSRMVGLPFLFRLLAVLVNEILEVAQAEKEKAEHYSKSKDKLARQSSRAGVLTSSTVDQMQEGLFTGELEIDPSKMKGSTDAFTNILALQLLCQKLLVSIRRSGPQIPTTFREILNHVYVTVEQRFPEYALTAVGGFLFLRLINPAILLPDSFGLSPAPPIESARRQLLLITKVLQNLANNHEFGDKEAFMIPMNSFIQQNQQSINDFLLSATSLTPEGVLPGQVVDPPPEIPNEIAMASYSSLHHHLVVTKPKVEAALDTFPDQVAAQGQKRMMRQVLQDIDEYRPPKEAPAAQP
eukprot:TRINITY_DN176_c0_g1_i5.p1 TRINITY_DN176_c0_g1~~TRINITY_DN176_c0_g1_i5.p1  ORF type:complete len:2751 (-),score=506.38 TRINITY_DN176_c0_g1_i5:66-8294(-)